MLRTPMLVRWLLLTLAVWVAAAVVPGVNYDNWASLLVAALVLAVLNTLVKPLLQVLSLPFIVVTFGVFLLVVNAAVLSLTACLVPGFRVSGFWPALGGSLVVSLVSLFFGGSGPRPHGVHRHLDSLRMRRPGPPPGRGPIIDV